MKTTAPFLALTLALAAALPLHRYGTLDWLAAWCKRDVNRLLPLLRLGDGDWRHGGIS